MPSDDREQQFERALARHLRGVSPRPACPDAEILAAYHERTLSLDEMSQWKQHIAACLQCQETLSLLEESNAVPINEFEEKHMPALAVNGMILGAASEELREEALPASAPVSEQLEPQLKSKRPAAWRWVVPVGAVAAGLLVWVAVQENKPRLSEIQAPVQVAENREPAVNPAPPPAPFDKSLPSAKGTSPARPQVSTAPAENRDATANRVIQPQAQVATRNAPATPASIRPDETSKDEKVHVPEKLEAGPEAGKVEPGQDQPPAVPGYSGGALKKSAAPPPSAAARASVPSTDAAASMARNEADIEAKPGAREKQKEEGQFPSARSVEVTSQNGAAQTLRDIMPQSDVIIMAPVDAYAWRVGIGGKIEHSTDGARTWMLQKSGLTTDLTAGSAPSGKICWVVGKAGTVLVTSDGGRHWKQVTSPTKEDLAGVDAVDAKRASVWIASHSKSFETNDGAVTWTPVVNK
jgi:hypothetical protein